MRSGRASWSGSRPTSWTTIANASPVLRNGFAPSKASPGGGPAGRRHAGRALRDRGRRRGAGAPSGGGVVLGEPVDFPCPARGYVLAGVSLHGLLFLCTGLGFLCTGIGFLCTGIGFLCVGVCLTTHAKKRGAQCHPPKGTPA